MDLRKEKVRILDFEEELIGLGVIGISGQSELFV